MLSISKPQTNLIYLSILVGRLDLTHFSVFLCKFALLLCIAFSTKPHIQGVSISLHILSRW